MGESEPGKEEFNEWLRGFTKQLSLRAIKVFQKLPQTEEARILGKQFLRSATSVGANYRAACRARSKAEYFAKLSICVEEPDEVLYWLELLTEADIFPLAKLQPLHNDFLRVLTILAKARKST